MNNINIKYISLQLSLSLRKLGFRDYILWIYRPEFAPALDFFDYAKLVADICDDEEAYFVHNRLKSLHMKKCTELLARKSDIVIVTAATLFDKFKGTSSRIFLAPNGFDSELFSGTVTHVPDDIKNITKPIIGFIGTLFHFLDFNLLNYIVKQNSDKSFVFIGNCESNAEQEWAAVAKNKNVFWLGRKRKEDIPSYIRYFDVCINPFKVDDVSRSVSPLKVFEYLAMKKPVVSVEMESLMREKAGELVYFAKDYDDFHRKLNDALGQHVDESRFKSVNEYSWDAIFGRMLDFVQSNLR